MPPQCTVFLDSIDDSLYYKTPSLLSYDVNNEDNGIAEDVLKEVQNYEYLQANPCQHLAQYYGCLVEEGRIAAIVLAKYESTLDDRVENGPYPLHPTLWLTQIRAGVQYLHDLGLAHNDLNPRNIMLLEDQAVIIDFDSCCAFGMELGKGGTPDWYDEEARLSSVSNDEHGLRKLEEYLMNSRRD
jgi:serine/threonine protein kinase